MIAVKATGDDILPGFCTPLDDGDYMVECKALSGALFSTILAGVAIPGVDIGPAEFRSLKALPDFYIFEKAENAGQLYGEADAPDFPVIFGQNLDLALAKQCKCTFPGDDVYGFIACI
jgi:hypothetical protein